MKKIDLRQDIYYQKKYISLYLKESEEIFEFEYNIGNTFLYNIAIKRPIKEIGSITLEDTFFDLETAYGYGGFYTNADDIFLIEAFNVYQKQCLSENIISEFVRFHPLNTFPLHYSKFLDFCRNDRQTVIIDLRTPYEIIKSKYSSSLRRNLKKAEKYNLQYKLVNATADNIRHFYDLYMQTMERNKAEKFYYFDIEYFNKLFHLDNIHIHTAIYKKNIINMLITLHSKDILYYHLGATDPNLYHLNSNPFLFDKIIQNFNKKHDFFYLGGGTDSQTSNSLLRFKKKFSEHTLPFYIGGKIYNHEIYDYYTKLWKQQTSKDIVYFLKYRAELS